MRVYLDNCCYNRPFDDQSQDKIFLEAESVLSILKRCQNKELQLVGSTVIEFEISNIQDKEKQHKVMCLYSLAEMKYTVSDDVKKKAEDIQRAGIKLFDSLHLAIADYYNVDVFLTTDEKLEKLSKRVNLKVIVKNPVNWIMEVSNNE